MTQLHTKRKPYYLFTLLGIFLVILLWVGFTSIFSYLNTHTFTKQAMVIPPSFHWPLRIEKKEEPKVVEKIVIPEYTAEIDTPIKKYVCDKFGVMDCKIALGVIQAESGFNDQAWNVNDNGSIDVGLWQINSIHFKQPGCSLKEVIDPIDATNCAYSIWKASGWNVWSSVNNGSYLAQIDK